MTTAPISVQAARYAAKAYQDTLDVVGLGALNAALAIALAAGTKRSLGTWLQDGASYHTWQVSRPGNQHGRVWAPGIRKCERRATFARFDGSRRDYAGLACASATADIWVGLDGETVIVYVRQP